MAKLILMDGTESDVTPKGKDFTLEELYALIGNGCDMVEALRLPGRKTMWLDEEGKYRPGLRVNDKATVLARKAGIIPWDVVMGNVLVTGPKVDATLDISRIDRALKRAGSLNP